MASKLAVMMDALMAVRMVLSMVEMTEYMMVMKLAGLMVRVLE